MSGPPESGALVLAGTPLGRISDASAGLRNALADADVIAAEDTRRLYRLARDLDVELSAQGGVLLRGGRTGQDPVAARADREGATVVLVTDAGMPCVSDPGYRLVAAAAAAGLHVTSVPGPSAVITALALSGLPSDRFTFEGFPPRKSGERLRALAAFRAERRTMVFFEAVHRIADTLAAMVEVFGPERPAALCRELTKTFEDVRRGTLADLLTAGRGGVAGEFTLVVGGAPDGPAEIPDDADLTAQVDALTATGMTRRDAIDAVAVRFGVPRRTVYNAAHR